MENEFIAWLRHRLSPHENLRIGIGDDAAILDWARRRDCVVTSDLLADGVHFRIDEVAPARIGRKVLAVNLSDLAAMAARPVAATVCLLLPRDDARNLAVQLYEGLLPLAEQYRVAVAGGDTNCWDGPVVISVTAIGEVTDRGPLRRLGAEPGDIVVVTGSFGGSILGRQFEFEPRVEEALWLNSNYQLHAGIDVSDGLSIDLWRMCEESGCGAELELGSIPISEGAKELANREAAHDTDAALSHALSDGEDFELILAVAPNEAERLLQQQPLAVPLTAIGRFVKDPGLWQQTTDGTRQPLPIRGFVHGR